MDKKEYNKKYYAENKGKIAEKLYAKEECPCCGRTVSHQNMIKHRKTSYCKSRSFTDVKQQILDLQNEIKELKNKKS
jgi:hypothetical protein